MSGGQKICVVCGEDCSGKPRTKDAAGRYFCTPCYQRKLEEKRQANTPSQAAPARPAPTPKPQPMYEAPAAPPPFDDPFAIDPNLLAMEAANAPAAAGCSHCGAATQAGAIICMNCGVNLQSGGQLQTSVYRAPRERASVWHIVVGVISIVFGACGLLYYSVNLIVGGAQLGSMNTNAGGAYVAGRTTAMVIVLIPLLLSLWLAISGIGVTMKRSGGVVWMRRWAITKIVLLALLFTCAGLSLALLSGSANAPPEAQAMLSGMGIVLLGFALWMFFWPIFVLIWFGRAKIQNDVGQW